MPIWPLNKVPSRSSIFSDHSPHADINHTTPISPEQRKRLEAISGSPTSPLFTSPSPEPLPDTGGSNDTGGAFVIVSPPLQSPTLAFHPPESQWRNPFLDGNRELPTTINPANRFLQIHHHLSEEWAVQSVSAAPRIEHFIKLVAAINGERNSTTANLKFNLNRIMVASLTAATVFKPTVALYPYDYYYRTVETLVLLTPEQLMDEFYVYNHFASHHAPWRWADGRDRPYFEHLRQLLIQRNAVRRAYIWSNPFCRTTVPVVTAISAQNAFLKIHHYLTQSKNKPHLEHFITLIIAIKEKQPLEDQALIAAIKTIMQTHFQTAQNFRSFWFNDSYYQMIRNLAAYSVEQLMDEFYQYSAFLTSDNNLPAAANALRNIIRVRLML